MTYRNLFRRVAANVLGLVSVIALVSGVVLQAGTPYGFRLVFDGRLTDLGCFALLLGILGVIAAMLPLASYVDERGLWKGDVR